MTDTPAPGTLEHLAELRPDETAIVDGPVIRTRAEMAQRANAIAAGLRATHGIGPGDRVATRLPAGAPFLELSLALAKLGATPVALPPTVTSVDPLADDELDALASAHADAAPLFSGTHPPPATLAYAGDPPTELIRTFDDARRAALPATVADLLDRLSLRPNAIHVMSMPPSVAAAGLHATVALIGGGAVVCAPGIDAATWLTVVAMTGATTAVVGARLVRELATLPDSVRDTADTTTLRTVVVTSPLSPRMRTTAADLLGEDTVHELYGPAITGEVAIRSPHDADLPPDAVGRPLAGVEVIVSDDGAISVRSPLAADPGHTEPVPTGDHGHIDADGVLHID